MKKLSKKQNLVCFISILLIAIILAIVITINAIRGNKAIEEEDYLITANQGSTMIANYIKEGITIGGITGTLKSLNTYDATATPEDVAWGKTCYVQGEKITGTRLGIGTVIDSSIIINLKDIYYADCEGDGTVDGVIYADLAVTKSGEWKNSSGIYEISQENNLKEYKVTQEKYTSSFGTGKVIAPITETEKNDRFYVMALEDIDSNLHYWYYNGRVDNEVTSSQNDFGSGRTNSERIIEKWKLGSNGGYGAQNENDMWGLIQNEVSKGWFIPSKSEWAAFGDNLGVTANNYNKQFNLSFYYWSSSVSNWYNAYGISFNNGIFQSGVDSSSYVRLSTTF